MSNLPVIIGYGGVNAAGRSSFDHAYRRLILDKLSEADQHSTLLGLATLMGEIQNQEGQLLDRDGIAIDPTRLSDRFRPYLLNNTLIRRIHPDWYDIDKVTFNRAAKLELPAEQRSFFLRKRQLPNQVPSEWKLTELDGGLIQVEIDDSLDTILPDSKRSSVRAAGQLPTGFKPGTLYQSRNHPRNLQMSIYSASDAIKSMGIDWEQIRDRLAPDQIAVYAGNSIGQLDDCGFGGLLKSPSIGKRTTSKQMPLGYGQMPADFVNAYLLGNLGSTGSSLGACASFLYNLRTGVEDIRSGRRQLVLVGASDAPITEEIIEGFRAMGALAEEKGLLALDDKQQLDDNDLRRTSRPFANNCGFTMGESSQFVVLCSDSLALEMGAQIFGSVPDVFVNADGFKKSISAPGVGNYITLAKSAALIRSMLGEESLRYRSYVQAHGTSTPQNRVTESHVLNQTAKAFDIPNWPVSALKCYIGHSQGTAGADQLALSLGTWRYGYIPGIATMDQVAEDVHASNLRFEQQHLEVGPQGMDSVLLNSKGFGGNNASAAVLAPHITEQLLERRHGKKALSAYRERAEEVRQNAAEYDQDACTGLSKPTYLFGHNVLEGEELQIDGQRIRIPGYEQPIELELDNPFDDMC
ncbi:beta-ketoacyl synthase [Motiliproteus coralliicola]|uniref:Beta-ketoacyl synthase n=1 Tax=Motiliproteus coralliicola TaxID=2283196 RepID=A0A369WR82_9GAMM|nr:beta-ketoacyl synthase [Motiliproteus coralliicola]RDE23056.1 beta-ketoacyl synthase [Motiliproteus coralliicola]